MTSKGILQSVKQLKTMKKNTPLKIQGNIFPTQREIFLS